MTDYKNIGTKGETLALNYLKEKGYLVLETNWRTQHLEIDIIAKHNRFIVFVEVKTRSGNVLLKPEDAVDKNKQKLLIRAANSYILSKNISEEARFDVISIIINNEKPHIQHIEDAFYPVLR